MSSHHRCRRSQQSELHTNRFSMPQAPDIDGTPWKLDTRCHAACLPLTIPTPICTHSCWDRHSDHKRRPYAMEVQQGIH